MHICTAVQFKKLISIPDIQTHMPLSKNLLSVQVFGALLLLALAAIWLFLHSMSARLVLGAALAISTIAILAWCGIFSGKAVDPKGMDRNTQTLALFVLVFSVVYSLFSLDLVGILGVWILVIALFVIFLAVIGAFISGRAMGLLLDSRNRMSLSTFQTILWTVILLSAFFTVAAALMQTEGKVPNAFDIVMDARLWALMGISVTTLAGTPLLKDTKSRRSVSIRAIRDYAKSNAKRILERIGREPNRFPPAKFPLPNKSADDLMDLPDDAIRAAVADDRDGPLCIAPDPMKTAPIDIFRGDELVNCRRVDLAKVQMFFFTVIGALAYMLILVDWLTTLDLAAVTALNPATFPVLSEGFVAVLGISHAGFLGNTAVAQTPES
jgi:uncharacterized protein YneF (UPF0154 family)